MTNHRILSTLENRNYILIAEIQKKTKKKIEKIETAQNDIISPLHNHIQDDSLKFAHWSK